MESQPTISTIIPVYNCGLYLDAAISSILNQSFQNFEIIAVNDGSTDQSLATLEQFRNEDLRIKIINQTNQGIVAALNTACKHAKGKYIARMDGDDIAHPERFAKQVDFLETHPDHVACGTHVYFVDTEGKRVKRCPRPLTHQEIEYRLYEFADGGSLIHPTLLVRRESMEQVGFYRQEANWIEDLDLFYRLSNIGKLGNLDEYLLDYRVRPGSVTYNKIEKKNEKKLWIIQQALAARNLPIENAQAILSCASSYTPPYDKHVDWAVTAMELSGKETSLKHAIIALRMKPFKKQSWSTLKYVISSNGMSRPKE